MNRRFFLYLLKIQLRKVEMYLISFNAFIWWEIGGMEHLGKPGLNMEFELRILVGFSRHF
jgi:hypothetical protein